MNKAAQGRDVFIHNFHSSYYIVRIVKQNCPKNLQIYYASGNNGYGQPELLQINERTRPGFTSQSFPRLRFREVVQ